jgi:hypothetical protein
MTFFTEDEDEDDEQDEEEDVLVQEEKGDEAEVKSEPEVFELEEFDPDPEF